MRVLRATLALVALIVVFNSTAGAAGHGGVFVTTLPPGAEVWMEGTYMGQTPLYIDGLDSGRHSITLTRAGWQAASAQADVTPGGVSMVSVSLNSNAPVGRLPPTPAKGYVSIRGAGTSKISLDGTLLPEPEHPQQVSAGDHILMVQNGSQRTLRVVRVYPLTTTALSLAPRAATNVTQSEANDAVLAALDEYVPAGSFTVSGDEITVHYRGQELACAIGSNSYVLNGRPGTLAALPLMVGTRPYLPLSLLLRISPQKLGQH